MATQYQNLSEYDPDLLPSKEILEKQSYAIAVSDWNPQVTHALLKGAIEGLTGNGVLKRNISVVHVPGTFELTYAAKQFVSENAKSKKYNAVIVLGCVVQGETPHFDYVCQGVTQGVAALNSAENTCPVIFGVLTTNTMQQALDRAGGFHGNKGVEAAITAIKMANIVW
ncbi:MAG: 6,7-dimethyl-8-ribityllumazine synthase [Paludibacter sp.]|nr:6,7-dimethyl-8-ribityllumazine synthase [Paludibacter sp.]MDD4199227.1 6,7-dimethyl-8-ribityllumazine synthase [Paludibacter sp.]MDD4428991.1 6,7-dimethyl-8-ribityllumazine synthase [Paludibacter sp.]